MTQLSLLASLEQNRGELVVRRSGRARRLSARVYRDGRVEVVAPPRASERVLRQFIERHRDWIERRREIALQNQPPAQPFPPAAIVLPAFGEQWRLHLAGGAGRVRITASDRAAGAVLTVRGQLGSEHHSAASPGQSANPPGALRGALQAWLMRHCRARLEAELHAVAAQTGLVFRRMALRRQRTRWGSCSTRGTISLNVCLAFQSRDVLRYLLIHELSHTLHMNHSAAFWGCVANHCPDWQRLDRELVAGWRAVPRWVFAGAVE